MAKKISVPRGTADIIPTEVFQWQDIECKARKVFNTYNYKEIRTPTFEDSGLFKRSLGETSDVVNKQLLGLASDKKEGFALRPEGTAPIVRSYIENSFHKKESITKFFYIGSMFRGERPQKGRLRQFHQIGAEIIGPATAHPYLDAEVIALNVYLLKVFGLNDFTLKLNTLGSSKDKENLSKKLRTLLKGKVTKLCGNCQKRFERNVFRILDCKNKTCREVVGGLKIDHSHLSKESQGYFANVTQTLDNLGVKYEIVYDLVRGLDYYTHCVFEITSSALGSQDALSAGGRYNHLVNQLGGPEVPAMGFALGIERVLLALPQERVSDAAQLQAYVVALEERFLGKAFKIQEILRAGGVSCDMSYQVASVKSQMRSANKAGALNVIIIGDEEDKSDVVTLKDMATSEQKHVALDELLSEIENVTERVNN